MRLDLNGIVCELPPQAQAQLLGVIWRDMERRYAELNGGIRGGMKMVSRKVLLDMERRARKESTEEIAMKIRPPKGEDPNMHLARVLFGIGNEALKDVTVEIDLIEEASGYRVADLRVVTPEGQAGRPVVDTGHDRIGQNDVREDAGRVVVEALPERALLHS